MPSQRRITTDINRLENEIKDIRNILVEIQEMIKLFNKEMKRINNPLVKKDLDLTDYINIDHDY